MPAPFINRELSWLEFNQRVLNEAFSEDLPLLERIKFLAISASNLDEFFQVRVGGLMAIKRSGAKTRSASGHTPTQCLNEIRKRVLRMFEDQYQLLNTSLLPELGKAGIHLLDPDKLDAKQIDRLSQVFDQQIQPLLTPLAIVEDESASRVPAMQVVIACRLRDPEKRSQRHVLIPIPDTVNRFIAVGSEEDGLCLIRIEDVVALHAAQLFPGESVAATTCFRITRNSDIVVDDRESINLAGEMENALFARRFSEASRLEIESEAPRDLQRIIRKITQSGPRETYTADGPLGLANFMELAFLEDFDHLRSPEWSPQPSPAITSGESMFDTIAEQDLLLHHPYESFEPVLHLLEEAAQDPDVLAIKQVLYRTAKKSRIIDALIQAAENGKNVTVLVELKARFDEARNLERADELLRAGAQIVYGVRDLKTHAKILMIVRREQDSLRRYVHLSTGNYNETTARLYTDLSFLTCRPEYGHDASLFFNAVSGRSKLLRFQRLIPAPTEIKPTLIELIDGEAERAKQGLHASIMAKINSLEDQDIIQALYRASRAGVEIQLNIRGICCLKTGDKRYSKNIQVVSIIDRYLEHARAFYFHHGGDAKVYISSADWMTRNLEKRVELMIPIETGPIKKRVIRILESCFKDNVQAYEILADGSSRRIRRKRGAKAFRLQERLFKEACKAASDHDHQRAMTFEPHVPKS
ncbi:MAG: polyphosphate kinase 1 [Akkermansiaceae bacterium]|nr:polyphosphate kinase 1 [Akkermansiaceae bacterium]